MLHDKGACVSFRARSSWSGKATRQAGAVNDAMSKGDLLEMEGVIEDALGGGQYTIKVDQGGAIVRAQLSGRMRRHHIRVLPGDRVRVAVSPYDLSHGLIVYRGRS
jgi:translation initiation factor IF-1